MFGNSLILARTVLASMILCVSASMAFGQSGDSAIDGALYDLGRAGQQLSGLTASNKSKINRIQNSLDFASERLEASTRKDLPAWQEAKDLLDSYQRQLAEIRNPQPSTNSSTQTTTHGNQQQGSTTDNHQPQAPSAAETAAAQAIAQRFNQLVGHYNIDVPQLQKVTEVDLDDPSVRQKWRTKMEFYESEMAAFQPYIADPNVKSMDDNVRAMITHFRGLEERRAAQLAPLGDIDARIAEMQARYDYSALPQRLDAPFTAEAIQQWASHARALQEQAVKDKQWLEQLLATTQIRAFDAQNLLNGSIGMALPQSIDRSLELVQNELLNPAHGLDPFIAQILDPNLPENHAYRSNLEGQKYEHLQARIDDAIRRIELALVIEQAADIDIENVSQARIDRLRESRGQLIAMHNTKVAGNRMPEAKSTDPELMKAAETVLAGERYGYEWERMVINYAPQQKEETKAWWDDEIVSVATYVWDEFQVATVEKTDDGLVIFYNELHYYHSADPTVPTGRWVLHNRFEGSPILAENLD